MCFEEYELRHKLAFLNCIISGGSVLWNVSVMHLKTIDSEYFILGEALLSVGMISPSGLPEAELSVKKSSMSMYSISYKVTEIGEHALYVKWGDDDIPGSPFSLST